MKKTISLILAMALVMVLAAAAFAFGPIGGGGISISNKYVEEFCKLVDAIGDPVHILHGGDMGDLIFVITAVGHTL